MFTTRRICGRNHTWRLPDKGGYLRHNGNQPCGGSIFAGTLGSTTCWRKMTQGEFNEAIDGSLEEMGYVFEGNEWLRPMRERAILAEMGIDE